MNRTVYYTEPVSRPCDKCGVVCEGQLAQAMHNAGGCLYAQRDLTAEGMRKHRTENERLRAEIKDAHERIDEAGGIPNDDERGRLTLAQRVSMLAGDLASFERVVMKLSGKLTEANGTIADTQALVKKVLEEWGSENAVGRDVKRIQQSLIPRGPLDVHTEHCCVAHGCKYGDAACPVETGKKRQSFPCELCKGGD